MKENKQRPRTEGASGCARVQETRENDANSSNSMTVKTQECWDPLPKLKGASPMTDLLLQGVFTSFISLEHYNSKMSTRKTRARNRKGFSEMSARAGH